MAEIPLRLCGDHHGEIHAGAEIDLQLLEEPLLEQGDVSHCHFSVLFDGQGGPECPCWWEVMVCQHHHTASSSLLALTWDLSHGIYSL